MRFAEFFSGIGLVGAGLQQEGWRCVFANDNDPKKNAVYELNFGGSHLVTGSIVDVRGDDVPDVELLTASFPCTDVSLAGNRAGLAGPQSGMLREVFRVVGQMGRRAPDAILLENVVGFATSHGGADLRYAVSELNRLDYECDVLVIDARHFVPQSRPRLFVLGARPDALANRVAVAEPSEVRPPWVAEFVRANPGLVMGGVALPELPQCDATLRDVVERFPADSDIWWTADRVRAFCESLSPIQARRLRERTSAAELGWFTSYRRTRGGRPVWEVRADEIAGCLRTTRGGSSKQAVVETGAGELRVRWMTGLEYARLQGAAHIDFGPATESQIRFALGDAVCVPVVHWLAKHYMGRLLIRKREVEVA